MRSFKYATGRIYIKEKIIFRLIFAQFYCISWSSMRLVCEQASCKGLVLNRVYLHSNYFSRPVDSRNDSVSKVR